MRLGVFGGTFDPVHLGHLILAEQCREQARLDQVRFIPAARPPHKSLQPLTAFAQRVEMLALAIVGQPAFVIDEIERERPGPSYTVETLTRLREAHPGAELFLLLGSDSLLDLPYWYQPALIAELATLVIMPRPEAPVPPLAQVQASLGPALRLQVVEVPLISIASRDLRRRAAAGGSIRYLVPRAVEEYIREKRLYRDLAQREKPEASAPGSRADHVSQS